MDKKKLFLILTGIVLLGLGLRLININKDEGMWNDEYLTYEIAKAALPVDFFNAIVRNCHAPLHYLYLKIWMYFFGESDFTLRLSSLVPGVLSIIMMFFAGRNLGKKTSDSTGLITAWFCAASAFLIYFSQEVRIYSLLFLLSSLHVYYAIKTMEEPSKKNCAFLIFSALLILLEHTIGFIFVFFSVISVLFFGNKKAKFRKHLVSSLLMGLIVLIPLGIFIYCLMFNRGYFSQWWAPFSFAKLGFFFTDLFSPYLINLTNAPVEFSSMFNNFGFVLFALVPLAITALCMLKGIFSIDKNVKYFLLTSIGVYLTVFCASIFGKIIFLTKYLTEIYPGLILLFVFGFVSFKGKAFKVAIGTIYSVLILFFILISQYSPVRLIRTEGQNIPVAMLNVLEYKNTDKVLFLYYPKERFKKYSIDITESKNTTDISKYDFLFIKDKNEPMKNIMKTGKENYRPVFVSNKNKGLDDFLYKNIYSIIQPGERFFLVDFSPVSIFGPKEFNKTIASPIRYEKTPFLFLVFSYIRNYIVEESKAMLSYNGVVNHLDWRIYVFEKT